jgi:hypothetical protein
MYRFLIDPEKWVNVGEFELEQNKPYWFKKSNGQIVMGTVINFIENYPKINFIR